MPQDGRKAYRKIIQGGKDDEAIGEARGAEKERTKAKAKIREERTKAETKIHEEKRAIARAMKADGLSAVKISKFTGLTPDEIEGL